MSHPCVIHSLPPFLFSLTSFHFLALFSSPFPPLGVIKKVGEAAEQAGTTSLPLFLSISLPHSTYICRTHRYSQGPHPSPPSPLHSFKLSTLEALKSPLHCTALSLALHCTALSLALHCTALSLALHCTALSLALHFTLPCTTLHSPLHCTAVSDYA
jgi:hypothetical protein